MLASRSQNLPALLKQAESVYRGSTTPLSPATPEMLAQRAAHFAAGVRLSVHEPQALHRLHEITSGLRQAPSLSTLLPKALDGALSLMRADFGNIQLLDPVTGSLGIVTQSGFDSEFLDYFAVVDDDHSACGRAAKECAQIVIADVNSDPGFVPHRDIAAVSGFRAVQSTPIRDRAGRPIGMVSTHYRQPHRPPALDLRIMELFADFVGSAIAAHLCGVDGDGVDDPIGQAVISALLDPGDGQGSRVQEQSMEDTMSEFAGIIVNRLFSVGLSLESARSLVGDGPAGDRLWAATQETDLLIRDIRTIIFNRAAQGDVGS